mgnify:CR=1 FL=1
MTALHLVLIVVILGTDDSIAQATGYKFWNLFRSNGIMDRDRWSLCNLKGLFEW